MNRMLPFALVFTFSVIFPGGMVWAQSNEFLDGLLAKQSITVGQTAYLILVASDNLAEDADEARAFELLTNMGWAPAGAKINQPIELASYSYILMRAFNLKGGIMYTLFPSPRYAFRELSSMQVIQSVYDPASPVDGSMAIQILSMVFDTLGAN
ncbi:MAG: hypothetical protein WCQ50_00225 [Spirochaetota bacterium]